MKNTIYKIFIPIFILMLNHQVNAQYFSHNWSHQLGNNGPGVLVINGSYIDNDGHYLTVGKITGAVDVDFSSSTTFIDGNHPSSSSYSAFLAEYDSSAAFLRAYAISPLTSKTSFEAVVKDANGNIIVAGLMADSAYLDPNNPSLITYSNGSNISDAFIAKYDASMNLVWAKTFPSANSILPKKILVDQQNNIVLAGEFSSTIDIDPSNALHNLSCYPNGNANSDAFLAKFDNNGQLLWSKNLGTTLIDKLGEIDIDLNNNIYIAVNYDGTSAFIDSSVIVNVSYENFMCVTKFNEAGQFVWNKTISPTSGSSVELYDMRVNNVGEIFFTGKLKGNAYFQGTTLQLNAGTLTGCDYLAKLSSSGNCIWAYASYTFVSVGYALDLDTQSNIYLSGTFLDSKDFDYKNGVVNLYSWSSTISNYYVASYDSTGSYRWAYRLATLGVPEVKVSNNDKIWLNGDFNSNFDIDPGTATNYFTTTNATEFVTAYSSSGNYQFGYSFKGSGATKEKVTALDVDNNGTLIVAGMFTGTIDLDPTNASLAYTSSLDSNAYIASYTSLGGLLWANQIKGMVYFKGIKFDNLGNIYATGYYTGAVYFDVNNFPSSYQAASGGAEDIFIAKYNGSGVLQWVHTFGSAYDDQGKSLSIDQNGNVIIGGIFTTLIDFDPSTTGTFNLTTPQNITSCFVAKYDANGNFIHAFKIVAKDLTSVCTDNNNNIITNGVMASFGNFNVTGGNVIVYSVGGSNDDDYYLAKYDSAGNYIWAFGLGNIIDNNQGSSICTDNAGNIYFAGYFGSHPDSIDINPGTAVTKIVGNKGLLVKYSSTGALLWGINSAIRGYNSIDVDDNGNPTITSDLLLNTDLDPGPGTVIIPSTYSSLLIVRYSAVGEYLNSESFETTGSNYDVFSTALKITDSNDLVFGGFFNGLVDFDAAPGNQNLFINTSGGTYPNGYIVSFHQPDYLAQTPPSAAFNSSSTNFCEGVCINFQDNSLYSPNNWNWSFPGANPSTSNIQNPQNICYPTAGTYSVQLIASNPLGADTLVMNNYIVVDAIPATNAGNDIAVCEGSSLQLNGSGATSYSWSPAATLVNSTTPNPLASPTATTTYTLTGTNGSCSVTDEVTITVNPNPSTPLITPVGGELQSSAAFAYQWYFNGVAIPGATLQTLFPPQIGNYTVTVFDASGCFASSNTYLVTVVGVGALVDQNVSFVISPNPVNDQINIVSSRSFDHITVKLYDITNKLISMKTMSFNEGMNNIDFSVANLNSGVYRIELVHSETLYSLRLFKMNN
jgi:PKD repeat protein